MEEKFILDANSFIEPYRIYYPFDLASSFWRQMFDCITNNENVIILDVVYKEILRLDGELSVWMKNIPKNKIINQLNKITIEIYADIIKFIITSGYYRQEAARVWTANLVADPWIISYASYSNATIITHEKKRILYLTAKSKIVKIPEVADRFNIKCENLFYFMRKNKIYL